MCDSERRPKSDCVCHQTAINAVLAVPQTAALCNLSNLVCAVLELMICNQNSKWAQSL